MPSPIVSAAGHPGQRPQAPTPSGAAGFSKCAARAAGIIAPSIPPAAHLPIDGVTVDSIRRLYSIRDQVTKDAQSSSPHRFMGDAAKQQAERLREEMDRRHLKFTPMEW